MKRLRKLAFGKKLWHGTSLESLRRITDMGMLSPNESLGSSLDPEESVTQLGFTFLATEKSVAEDYAFGSITIVQNVEDRFPIVLEVNISQDALQADNHDTSKSLTWQETADTIGQVKITGPVTDDYFEKVYFYDPYGNEIFNCNFKGWTSKFEEHRSDFDEHIEKHSQNLTDFETGVSQLGLDVKDGLVVNQPMYAYSNLLMNFANSNNGPNEVLGIDFVVNNGDITYEFIDINKLHQSQRSQLPHGKDGDFSFSTYCAELPFKREDFIKYCGDFPNFLENIKVVFNNIALVFMGDYTMTIYTPQDLYQIVNGDQKTASRLKKRGI